MTQFHKGDRVLIQTKYGGRYDGQTGTVRRITTINPEKADGEWVRWSSVCEGWYEVWFDHPLSIETMTITKDVFQPEELQIYKED